MHESKWRSPAELSVTSVPTSIPTQRVKVENDNFSRMEWAWAVVLCASTLVVLGASAAARLRRGRAGPPPRPGDLTAATIRGDIATVARLLRAGAPVEDGSGGWSALHWAALSGNCAIGRELLQHGARAGAVNGIGDTPLHGAAANGHTDFCRLLAGCGADVNARDADGTTALTVAGDFGHCAAADAIRAAGGIA